MDTKLAWLKKNGLQGNCCILWIDIAWGQQQLGVILEYKVPPNSKWAKDAINESC